MNPQKEPVLPAGTMLAHYRLAEVLGAGGMGTVYKAHDTSLDRSVAVKVLRTRYADDSSVIDRFVREARAAARVNHPNLAHIYFVSASGDQHFFTMEYVSGASLDKYVKEAGPLPLGEVVELLSQAARGLAATHAAGVIHRDVKPGNLIRREDGALKVADFGLSKSTGGDFDMTGAGALVGTPTYMAPEQCRGEKVDVRTDIYALGLVAYYLLVGEPAFHAEAIGKVLDDQMNAPLPSILDHRPELSPTVDAVLGRLCAKKPDERPESMEEVARLLETIRPRVVHPAPTMSRAAAAGIDLTLVVILSSVVSVIFAGLLRFGLPSSLAELGEGVLQALVVVAALLGMELAYHVSVGKWLLHLQVVAEDGTAPGSVALLLRFLLRYPLAFAVLEGFFDPPWFKVSIASAQVLAVVAALGCSVFARRRTLSDLLTHTLVTTRIRAVSRK